MVALKEAGRSVLIALGQRTAKQGPFGIDANMLEEKRELYFPWLKQLLDSRDGS